MSLVKIPFIAAGTLGTYACLTPPQPKVSAAERPKDATTWERVFSATVRFYVGTFKVSRVQHPPRCRTRKLTPIAPGPRLLWRHPRDRRHSCEQISCAPAVPEDPALAGPGIHLPDGPHRLLAAFLCRLRSRGHRRLHPLPVLPHARPFLHIRGDDPQRPPAHHGRPVRVGPPPQLHERHRVLRRPRHLLRQRGLLAQGMPYPGDSGGEGRFVAVCRLRHIWDSEPRRSRTARRQIIEGTLRRAVG